MRGKMDGYMYLLTEFFENIVRFFHLRVREICHLRLDIADIVHGKSMQVGWMIHKERAARDSGNSMRICPRIRCVGL